MILLFFLNIESVAWADELDDLDDLWSEDIAEEEQENAKQNVEQNGKVYMKLDLMDHDILKLSVLADAVQTPVVGLAFHLKYEKEKLYFLKYEPGEFLEDGGDPFYMVQNNPEKGEVVFGETLRRDDRFPVGGKEIVNFYFQTNEETLWKNEVIKFEFERPVISTIDTVRQDISGVAWENLFSDKNGINRWTQSNAFSSGLFAVDAGKSNTTGLIMGVIFGIVLIAVLLKYKSRKRQATYVNRK